MASRQEADRTLAFHVGDIISHPNVTSVSVIEDDNGICVIEVGLVTAEGEAETRSAASPAIPETLTIPDAAGSLRASGETIPVRKRVVGRAQVQAFTGRQRPAPGGYSCGPVTSSEAGTLGARVNYQGTACFISCWHVLCDGGGTKGTAVMQPGARDGGTSPKDVIAENLSSALTEYLDAAIARINKPVDENVSSGTTCYGAINGTAVATKGQSVRKCGRTTGATTGTVISTNATVKVGGYPTGDRVFNDQLQLTGMSQGGDSGSIILDDKNMAVGLLFSGSGTYTWANKFSRVLDAFPLTF